MSTFVELVNELRSLSGVSGTGPTDVENVSGMEARLVNYIKNAWIDIQTHPKKWKWMWEHFEPTASTPLQTIANTNEYSLNDPDGNNLVDRVRTSTFRSYLTATGTTDRQRMTWLNWNQFQKRYGVVNEAADRPIQATRNPAGNILLYPKPDDIYSIEFEVFTVPQYLLVNEDVPDMPLSFHELIVYEGMKRFGKAEDAPETTLFGETAAGSEGGEGKPVSGLWRALIWDQEYKNAATEDEDEMMIVRTRGYEDY